MEPKDILWTEVEALFERISAAPLPEASQSKEFREALAKHLDAVFYFIRNVADGPLAYDGLKGFAILSTALNDLNNGTVHRFLRPDSAFQNRHPDPSSRLILRWLIVRSVDVLMRAKMTEKSAAAAIANILCRLKFPSNTGYQLSEVTVIGWRKTVRKDPGYSAFRDEILPLAFDGRSDAEVIKLTLQNVEDNVREALRDGYGG